MLRVANTGAPPNLDAVAEQGMSAVELYRRSWYNSLKMFQTSSDPMVIETPRKPEVERAITLFLDALRKDCAVDEVRLYGSRARGDFRPDSDVDLAIVLRGPRGDIWDMAWAMSDITFDVLLETGVSVSPLPLWGDDLDHPERAKNPALIRNIQREGIRL
jgi:uncharacterized protein